MHWKLFNTLEDRLNYELLHAATPNEFEAHKLIHAIAGTGYREVTKSCFHVMQEAMRKNGWGINQAKDWMTNQVSSEISHWIILACVHDINNIAKK